MNFVNCNGGAGACAGDKVYERIFSVCPGVSLRFNGWYTTTFSGTQCDVKLVISDGNGLVLDSIQNLVAPTLLSGQTIFPIPLLQPPTPSYSVCTPMWMEVMATIYPLMISSWNIA
ncbi:MAG: hypothetical protein IPP46_10140 [Bacteroidetes bacterium]|nr:hypothetical protein [Bacteroidota bacterium]